MGSGRSPNPQILQNFAKIAKNAILRPQWGPGPDSTPEASEPPFGLLRGLGAVFGRLILGGVYTA